MHTNHLIAQLTGERCAAITSKRLAVDLLLQASVIHLLKNLDLSSKLISKLATVKKWKADVSSVTLST